MKRNVQKAIVMFLVAALAGIPFGVAPAAAQYGHSEDLTPEMMAADAVLVRPLGVVATVLGFSVFLVSLPFSALGGNAGAAYDNLVREPACFTFQRPLGDF